MTSMTPDFAFLNLSFDQILSSAFICQWRDVEILDCSAVGGAYESTNCVVCSRLSLELPHYSIWGRTPRQPRPSLIRRGTDSSSTYYGPRLCHWPPSVAHQATLLCSFHLELGATPHSFSLVSVQECASQLRLSEDLITHMSFSKMTRLIYCGLVDLFSANTPLQFSTWCCPVISSSLSPRTPRGFPPVRISLKDTNDRLPSCFRSTLVDARISLRLGGLGHLTNCELRLQYDCCQCFCQSLQ